MEILLLTSKIEAELNVGHVFALQTNFYGKMLGQNVKKPTSNLSLHSAKKISTCSLHNHGCSTPLLGPMAVMYPDRPLRLWGILATAEDASASMSVR